MIDPQHHAHNLPRGLLALCLALGLTALLLAGCSLLKTPAPPDPLAAYRPALKPDFSLAPDLIDAMPRYSITVRIDPEHRAYTGTMDVTLPVTGSVMSNELYFRLYPNLAQFDGSMEVNSARVNDLSVNYGYAADGTAAHLVVPELLQPGSTAHVQMTYAGKAPLHNDGYYTIFGVSEDILNLTNFYPILAGRRGDSWALDIADPQGDVGFHDAALYRVTIIAPIRQVVVASGTATGAQPADDGWVAMSFVQGPAREFTVLLSPRFRVRQVDAYGTRIRSYYLPEHEEAGLSALYDGVAALEIYSDRFGPYPYRDMSVVEAPLTFHGMEFPGMSLIGSQTYTKYKQDMESRVSHEVGHQWWYNQVGSDQIDSPWQDEGLTEFSMYYYYADRYGVSIGNALRRSRWATPVEVATENGTDASIGQPVADYGSNYETMVYAKGALFFATLRDEMGADTFQRFLQAYLQRFCWRIATPSDVQSVAEEVSGKDLSDLFQKWLDGGQ